MIRRKADIRWKKNPAELDELPKLQLEILNSAAKTVKHGGILVYSTCTIISSENEDVVKKFLTDNPDFKISDTKKFLPHIDNTDGLFAAKFIRERN